MEIGLFGSAVAETCRGMSSGRNEDLLTAGTTVQSHTVAFSIFVNNPLESSFKFVDIDKIIYIFLLECRLYRTSYVNAAFEVNKTFLMRNCLAISAKRYCSST